jgi:hypothetical protein
MNAAKSGFTEPCQLLINAKADVNAAEKWCAFMFEICC